MIPRTSGGGGFRGAAAYYLHDKDARTQERVRFTHSINLSSDNPDRAIAEMCWTAMHAEDLKAAAGVKGGGRKLEKPVYTLALSWHPTEKPTNQEMIDAGLSALKALKMEDHQVLMVAHNDTEHPHVHLIVNRVDPQTGKAHGLNKDQIILSKWAQAYELEHGKTFCQARVKNNLDRKTASIEKAKGHVKTAFVKDEVSQKRDQRAEQARRAIEARAKAAAAAKVREAEAYARKQAQARIDKYEQWATAQLNALQDRQLEQRGVVGLQMQNHRMRAEMLIEKHYGKDHRENAARLAELQTRQQRGKLSRFVGKLRGEDREIEALEKEQADLDMRIASVQGATETKEQAVWAALSEQHQQERQKLDTAIERGRLEGHTVPGVEPKHERSARERNRGMERDFHSRGRGQK